MKVGDYVRTKYGIAKYIRDMVTKQTIYKIIDKDIVYDNVEDWENCLCDNEIIKSSPNITDLIKAGDYVNGMRVKDINYVAGFVIVNTSSISENTIFSYNIKSIVTKEQFENMEYRVDRE